MICLPDCIHTSSPSSHCCAYCEKCHSWCPLIFKIFKSPLESHHTSFRTDIFRTRALTLWPTYLFMSSFETIWVVVSNIFYFHPNHQLAMFHTENLRFFFRLVSLRRNLAMAHPGPRSGEHVPSNDPQKGKWIQVEGPRWWTKCLILVMHALMYYPGW